MEKNNKPQIVLMKDGPICLFYDSDQEVPNLLDHQGKQIEKQSSVALCRCGATKKKPFCDGTHSSIGFKTENTCEVTRKTKSYDGKEIVINDSRKVCCHAAKCISNLPSVFDVKKKTMD